MLSCAGDRICFLRITRQTNELYLKIGAATNMRVQAQNYLIKTKLALSSSLGFHASARFVSHRENCAKVEESLIVYWVDPGDCVVRIEPIPEIVL